MFIATIVERRGAPNSANRHLCPRLFGICLSEAMRMPSCTPARDVAGQAATERRRFSPSCRRAVSGRLPKIAVQAPRIPGNSPPASGPDPQQSAALLQTRTLIGPPPNSARTPKSLRRHDRPRGDLGPRKRRRCLSGPAFVPL